jgi:mannose-6-phosphate isomerase-like protein (cupin superfamily)
MALGDTAVSIVIDKLADGPRPPVAAAGGAWPNVLHTRWPTSWPAWARPRGRSGSSPTSVSSSPLSRARPEAVNRPHWHREFDEWWVVLAGQLEWELTGGTVSRATKDEIVWVPRGTVHHIRNVGDGLSLRLACAMPPANHYYSPCEQCGYDRRRPARMVRVSGSAMADRNTAFVGDIPRNYDRYLGPVLFHEFADDLAQRIKVVPGMRVLELACGTGIVTRRLADRLADTGPSSAPTSTRR